MATASATSAAGWVLFSSRTTTPTWRPSPAPGREITLNYGGGARWFNTPHLAFCFDVRFYETKPVNPTPTSPGRDRRRLLFLSAGISLR